ncbi:MAG: glycosyltransferase, partial [Proteobacteria bacterium]|nr:glycosyltransferase [Pseudomonadota bacterium]
MDRPLRLCLIHVHEPLRDAFQALGCEVLWLMPGTGGVMHLPTELAAHGFTPDIVFQQELLGPRLLLGGLDELDAVRLFWSVDPHLNAFWHSAYIRLFDASFSTQRRLVPELRALGAGHVRHLPWYAPEEPFTPFAQRQRDAGFVGRLGVNRPARAWLAELLGQVLPGRFEARDDLDFAGMLAFYRDTRLAPNESIRGEINFRLFEAAGCGCVVLAQDLGSEQAELFEPGREMLVCADALELAQTARMLCAQPRLAAALGRAAWERARAHHLPVARAKTVLETAGQAGRNGASAADGQRWLTLALAGL